MRWCLHADDVSRVAVTNESAQCGSPKLFQRGAPLQNSRVATTIFNTVTKAACTWEESAETQNLLAPPRPCNSFSAQNTDCTAADAALTGAHPKTQISVISKGMVLIAFPNLCSTAGPPICTAAAATLAPKLRCG